MVSVGHKNKTLASGAGLGCNGHDGEASDFIVLFIDLRPVGAIFFCRAP